MSDREARNLQRSLIDCIRGFGRGLGDKHKGKTMYCTISFSSIIRLTLSMDVGGLAEPR